MACVGSSSALGGSAGYPCASSRSPTATAHSNCRLRFWHWCCCFSLLLLATGCSSWHLAGRTLHRELKFFSPVADGYRSCRQYRCWANEAWQAELEGLPADTFSKHYQQGFREGFLDYVFAGGTGLPPAIPPRRFWNIRYRSTSGDNAIAQWRQGFVGGTRAARKGGYRQRAVVPALQELSRQNTGWPAEYETSGTVPPEEVDNSEWSGLILDAIPEDVGSGSVLPGPAPPPWSSKRSSSRSALQRTVGSGRLQNTNRVSRARRDRTNS